MGLGSTPQSGLGLSSALQQVVRAALEAALVYPVWLRVPLLPGGGDVGWDADAAPRGVLLVAVLSCTHLKVGACPAWKCFQPPMYRSHPGTPTSLHAPQGGRLPCLEMLPTTLFHPNPNPHPDRWPT